MSDYRDDEPFDDEPYLEAPRRRSLLPMVVAMLALGGFAGIVWYAYTQGLQVAQADAPPTLTADAGPVKERPEDPGGIEIPHRDKMIYNNLGQSESDVRVEKLLPPPETPKVLTRPDPDEQTVTTSLLTDPPAVDKTPVMVPEPRQETEERIAALVPVPEGGTVMANDEPAPEADAASLPGASSEMSAAVSEPPADAGMPGTEATAPAAVETTMTTEEPAAEETIETVIAAVTPTATPEPAEKQPAEKQPAQKQPTGAAPAAEAPAGDWRIQLSALRSDDAARKEWTRLQKRYQDLLGELTLHVEKVDLGQGKGIFYRVQGGPLDRNAAKEICAQLKSRQQGCLVAKS